MVARQVEPAEPAAQQRRAAAPTPAMFASEVASGIPHVPTR